MTLLPSSRGVKRKQAKQKWTAYIFNQMGIFEIVNIRLLTETGKLQMFTSQWENEFIPELPFRLLKVQELMN